MGLSFNLYHRRLLGYCLVTSGVLMAVVASLSHALSFLILLCGFIAIGEIATKFLSQPGNNNYPDIIKQDNLQLPPELATQLQQSTQQILATSLQPLKSDYDRAAYLAD